MQGVRGSAPHLSAGDREALSSGRYGMAIALMREMGWSWQDLSNAPFDLVQELAVRIQSESHWQQEKRRVDRESRKRND